MFEVSMSNQKDSQLQNFVQTYQSAGKGSPQLKQFSHTLWYYLMGEE